MMNWSRYKFSKEAEPELQEFLKVVAEQPTSATNVNIWQILLPSELSTQERINSKIVTNYVDLTEEEEETKNVPFNEHSFIPPDQSFTQLALNDTKLDLSSTDEVISGIQELLQSEEILPDEVIKQLGTELSKQQLKEAFTLISREINGECVMKFWKSLSLASCLERGFVVRMFFRFVLFTKVSSECDNAYKAIFEEAFTILPAEIESELQKFLFEENKDCDLPALNNLSVLLSPAQKNKLLSTYTTRYAKLNQYHLQSLEGLITPQSRTESLQKLIEMMSDIAKEFAREKNFGKLLLEVLEKLGMNVQCCNQQIRSILSVHKSVYKAQIVKTYKSNMQDFSFSTQNF